MDTEQEICGRCDHAWHPHVLIATMYSPIHGGMIFCNVPGCMCESTWSIDGEPKPYIPDEEEVAQLRATVQDAAHSAIPEDEWPLGGEADIAIE